MLAGCAAQHDLGASANVTLAAGSTLVADPNLETQAVGILNSKCVSCHGARGMGGISNITDKLSLYRQGLITPGNGTQGVLINSISPGGNMPLGGVAVTAQELQTIESWINSMQMTSPSPTPLPSPQPTPSPPQPIPSPSPTPPPSPPSAPQYRFSDISADILQPYCVRCHGDMGSYSGTMRYVSAPNPSQSLLYTYCADGSMPRGGQLSPSQLSEISSWIQSGAPD